MLAFSEVKIFKEEKKQSQLLFLCSCTCILVFIFCFFFLTQYILGYPKFLTQNILGLLDTNFIQHFINSKQSI